MGTEFDLFFGIGAIIAGAYCLYAAIMMKKAGVVTEALFLDKETALKKCKDKAGFVKMVLLPTIVLGLTILVYGALLIVNVYVVECFIATYVLLAITMVVLVWFAIITKKARNQFY